MRDEAPGYWSFRGWLMPASLINEFGTVEIQEIDEEPDF
jgi:hypothetical protein